MATPRTPPKHVLWRCPQTSAHTCRIADAEESGYSTSFTCSLCLAPSAKATYSASVIETATQMCYVLLPKPAAVSPNITSTREKERDLNHNVIHSFPNLRRWAIVPFNSLLTVTCLWQVSCSKLKFLYAQLPPSEIDWMW